MLNATELTKFPLIRISSYQFNQFAIAMCITTTLDDNERGNVRYSSMLTARRDDTAESCFIISANVKAFHRDMMRNYVNSIIILISLYVRAEKSFSEQLSTKREGNVKTSIAAKKISSEQ